MGRVSPESRWDTFVENKLRPLTIAMLGGLLGTQLMYVVSEAGSDSAASGSSKTVEQAVAENQQIIPPVETTPTVPLPPLPPEILAPPCTKTTIPWLPETVARWHPYVEQAARLHSVPAEYLEILMFFETLGKPDAVSSANAHGLIQILPSTAAGLFASLGLPELDLHDPRVNIYLSAKKVSDTFYGGKIDTSHGFNTEAARRIAISYHGGGGDLDFYVQHGLEALRNSGSPRTARYAERVAQAWDERHLPASHAHDDLMRTPEGQKAMRDAAAVGTPPC